MRYIFSIFLIVVMTGCTHFDRVDSLYYPDSIDGFLEHSVSNTGQCGYKLKIINYPVRYLPRTITNIRSDYKDGSYGLCTTRCVLEVPFSIIYIPFEVVDGCLTDFLNIFTPFDNKQFNYSFSFFCAAYAKGQSYQVQQPKQIWVDGHWVDDYWRSDGTLVKGYWRNGYWRTLY